MSHVAPAIVTMRVLDELVRAAHQCVLYGLEHPITQQACSVAAASFAALMADRPRLTLTVSGSGLAAEGEELPDRPPLRQLRDDLRHRQIAALIVEAGVSGDEIAALIGVLATDAVELDHAGGAGRALAEAQCPHIELVDVNYGQYVPASHAELLSSFPSAARGVPANVEDLVNVCLEIPGERLAIPSRRSATEHGVPMPFPVPIVGMAGGASHSPDAWTFRDQMAALHGVSPDDYVAVGLAWLIQASGEAVLDAPPGDRRAWREIVTQRVAELDLGLQARIFRAPRQDGSSAPDMLTTLVADRTPEQIADLILARPAAVVGEPSALLERILRRTLTEDRKLLAVELLLRQRLMERGMSQDSFRNVVGLLLDQIGTDMAMRVGGRVEWLGDFETTQASAGGTVHDWPDLLRTISNEAVAQARARILLNMLPRDYDPAHYAGLLSCLEASLAERAAAMDPQVLDIARGLADEAQSQDAIRGPIARATLQRAATAEVACVMRDALTNTAGDQRAELIVILGKLGNRCAEVLLEEIESTQDPQLRALAVRCLADAGERGASEVRRLLAQSPFDCSMLTAAALLEGSDQRFLNLLTAGFDHRQPMVRARLAEWLGHIPGLVSEQLLIRALYDEDPAVQARAAESLGEKRATGAVHALTLAATRGTLHSRGFEVRRAAIQALGRIGSPDAVPALKELMRKRSLWFRDRAEELAMLAASALAVIPGPDAERALEQSSRQMREVARQAREGVGVARKDGEESRGG